MPQSQFLSYSRKDNEDGFVKKLYDRLIAEGHEVWWDMKSMPSRQLTFLTEIRDAVHKHERLILVASPDALKSKYVEAEWRYALSICKPIHVILRGGDYPDIPPELALFDAPDFREDANFDKAFEHLQRHLAQEPEKLGKINGIRPRLPDWHIERDNIMGELENMVLIDSMQPVVVTSKQQVSALHGMGGIGKTTVANAFSERCATRRYFPDGIFWVTLGKTPDITFQQANIGKVFGDDPQEYLSPKKGLARLQALLSDKKVLFVLDDVWEKDHADAFNIQGQFTRTLITTRQQDLVTQVAMSVVVEKLTVEEGLRLFDARLKRKIDAIRPHEAIERQIIELLDGHTLCIELASAQLFKRGEDYAPRLLERLKKNQETDNPFADLEIEGDSKNANVEISLAISYEDLSADEQHRFRVLGVLAPNAPFTYGLMQALYEDDDDGITEDNLDTLQNMALIGFGEVGSYIQHSLLRDYASALLKRQSEYKTNLYNYLEIVTNQSKKFETLPLEEWFTFDDLIPHVLYSGDTLDRNFEINEVYHEIALQFADNTAGFVHYRPEAHRRNWLEMGLVVAQQRGDSIREALFFNELGLDSFVKGDIQQALQFYNQALPLRRLVGDKRGEATTLSNIGSIYSAQGNTEQTAHFYHQALLLFQETGDKKGEANVLNKFGRFYSAKGDQKQALYFFNLAWPISRKARDKLGEAAILNNIALSHDILGNKQQALHFYVQALPLTRQVGNKRGEATTLANMGAVHSELGDTQKAIHYFEEALSLYYKVDDKAGQETTLNKLQQEYSDLGNQQQMLSLYNEVLSLYEQVGDKRGEATMLNNIGRLYDVQGDKQHALHFYQKAFQQSKEISDQRGEATTQNNIGLIYSQLGDEHQALHFYKQALTLFKKNGDIGQEADIIHNIGRSHYRLGNKQQALDYYNQALPLLRQVEDQSGEATVLNSIASFYLESGDKHHALSIFEQVLSLRKIVKDTRGEAITLQNIAQTCSVLGDKSQALTYFNQALDLIRQVGDKYTETSTLYNIASLYHKEGNLDESIRYLQQCVELEEAIGHPSASDDRRKLERWKRKRFGGS